MPVLADFFTSNFGKGTTRRWEQDPEDLGDEGENLTFSILMHSFLTSLCVKICFKNIITFKQLKAYHQ